MPVSGENNASLTATLIQIGREQAPKVTVIEAIPGVGQKGFMSG
jgi:hypothetical protein